MEIVVQVAMQLGPTPLADLLALSVALGALSIGGLTDSEEDLTVGLPEPMPLFLAGAREAIARGEDPLGDSFCRLFSNEERRPKGATYTPHPIVHSMLDWADRHAEPGRIVDPGSGSARFLVAAGRRFPRAELVAIEIDPVASLLARGHLAAAGMARRARVLLGDYRDLDLGRASGQTLFIGNPPYVRHHLIEPFWKKWLTATARRHGHEASQLSGLHVHFFLATAEHARVGDIGVFITAAEWLDVNYGRLVRELLTGVLGASSIWVIEPSATPFPGTQTTAVITGFEIGAKPAVVGLGRIATIEELGAAQTERFVHRERLEAADRWSPLTRDAVERREGFVELGELCRVHRGAVTGANDVWVAADNAFKLPDDVLFASVTRARELFATDGALSDASRLRWVIDLPLDLDGYDKQTRARINKFLAHARSKGTHDGYIARHRKAWWSVGLREPAPILATYMARRPPTFVRNVAEARHINIAHGLYPRLNLTPSQLTALAVFLSKSVSMADGRTYAGGLTKFEPREMERLLVPRPDRLTDPAFLIELT